MATVNEKMTAIADAIRDKTGKTDKLTLDDMATDIEAVYSRGAIDGYHSGQQAGYNEGETVGVEIGKKSQYDEFWDALQYSGNRRDYIGVFSGRGWNDENFKPKYDIKPIRANYIFMNDADWGSSNYNGIKDLVTCLERAGVMLDFSACTNFTQAWGFSCVEHIGVVDTRSSTAINQTFYYSTKLHTIDEIILKDDGSQTFTNGPFGNCTSLANVTFTGCIGQNISFSGSPALTYDSLINVINALKDYSGTTTTRTLTLHATAKAKLSDSDIAIATQKGWTIA